MNDMQRGNQRRLVISMCIFSALGINPVLQAITWHVPADIPTLKTAVEDSAGYGDTVMVAAGTYNTASGEVFPINMQNGVVLISQSGPSATTIDANASDRVFDCQALDSTTVIHGFTITGGSAFDAGGIYCNNSFMKISDNIIKGNAATGYVGCGGGIYCDYDNSSIIDNLITENTALSYMGGGIYCYYSGSIIEGNTVAHNTARYGGGIFNDHSAPLIKRNLVRKNHALETGGGIDCYMTSSPAIVANVIIDNTCMQNGAGIACCYSCIPVIYNNTIARNAGQYGGGTRTLGNSAAELYMNAIIDNVDGLYLTETSGAMTANHNNIYYNSYQQGGYEVINNTSYNLDMTSNFWWTNDSSAIDSLIFGQVNFTPFLSTPDSDAPGEPLTVSSVAVMSDSTYTTPQTGVLSYGDTLFIELQGTNWNNAFVDPALVIICSNKDTYGIGVALIETDTATGMYHGTAYIDTTSNDLHNCVGVYQHDTVIIKANVDHSKRDTVFIGTTGISETEKHPASRGMVLHSCPNPFSEKTEISFHHPVPGEIQLRIFDVLGRLVKSFNLESCILSHASSISWDGRDNQGRHIKSGIYLCQLEDDHSVERKSIIFINNGGK
ncbi:hypothetical protein AMJ83_06220 [candidate division WOR_3 bacterium SM23_42]|uniref:Right handed beta helix domain-containing protein n=1 Tax=candidate division WOR_3 bacterium SM23_42 TaxID=1703779 RepID=A0A0S8FS66_UNCW3|nr:MAG: hypothetical protein AMJ83_06220 [candidate division WOR_3 bacterium SM23_42]